MKKKTLINAVKTVLVLAIVIALGIGVVLTGLWFLLDRNSPLWDASKRALYESGVPELVELETVEDEFGSYKRTTLKDISSITLTNEAALNKEDGDSAKDFIIKFIVEEALDSIALDNEAQWDSWKTNMAPKYIHPDYIDEILGSGMAMSDEVGTYGGQGIILTDAGNSMPNLKRDGTARSTDKLFKNFILDQDSMNPDIMKIYTTGSSFYSVKDEDAKAFWREFYGNNDFDSRPWLNDGLNQDIQVDFNLSYTLEKHDGQWKIAGFSNEFRVLSGGM